ncbi:MAG: hypothetical protein M3Z02_08540, partial [Actinomycetota bacterium]|nr:hypothetical protein [Actinomycetota bacterium]
MGSTGLMDATTAPARRQSSTRRAPAAAAASSLLASARRGLVEAAGLPAPAERYATAHLAAL